MKTPKLSKALLKVLGKIFFLLFHIFDKIESSRMFVCIFGSIVFDSLVNEGNLLRISDGHFNNSNILRNIKIYDVCNFNFVLIFVNTPTKISFN
jgi:hypothetical protein